MGCRYPGRGENMGGVAERHLSKQGMTNIAPQGNPLCRRASVTDVVPQQARVENRDYSYNRN